MAAPKTVNVNADFKANNDSFKLNQTVNTSDMETVLASLSPTTDSTTMSSSSLLLVASQPVNTNLLGGTPQTNVRLLILLADPA
jgi:hypothetical protein